MHTQMMILAGLLGVLLLGSVWYMASDKAEPAPVACTMEAKICPDGTAVGRTGPNCEFAACPAVTPSGTDGGTVSPVVEHFSALMYGGVTEQGGHPIEGFQPSMFLDAFPRLQVYDFDGVEAALGTYVVKNDEVVYERDPNIENFHTAERAITDEGMETLLSNISERLSMPIGSEAEVDTLVASLGKTSVQLEARIGTTVRTASLALTPRTITEDSRCPVDVACIWAGTLKVQADVASMVGNGSMVFELGVPMTTESDTITLLAATPEPRSTAAIAPSDYRFTFVVKPR